MKKDITEEQKSIAIADEKAVADLYGGNMNKAGTEEMNQEDFNIPYLILLQNGTKIPELGNTRKVGYYYRTDTTEQKESYDVNFVYVTNEERFDEKKKITKKYKAYFGYYAGTTEPFKLRMRGWGLSAHKQLQSEIAIYQQRYQIPMFALTVRMTSENKQGVTKDGESYDIEKLVCEVLRDPTDPKKPLIEGNPNRVGFLYESISRFKSIAPMVPDKESE